jgi:hypothetical protein
VEAEAMTEYGFAAWIIFVVAWIALMRYILPKMGIPTCMSGMCGLPGDFYKQESDKNEGQKRTADMQNTEQVK